MIKFSNLTATTLEADGVQNGGIVPKWPSAWVVLDMKFYYILLYITHIIYSYGPKDQL